MRDTKKNRRMYKGMMIMTCINVLLSVFGLTKDMKQDEEVMMNRIGALANSAYIKVVVDRLAIDRQKVKKELYNLRKEMW